MRYALLRNPKEGPYGRASVYRSWMHTPRISVVLQRILRSPLSSVATERSSRDGSDPKTWTGLRQRRRLQDDLHRREGYSGTPLYHEPVSRPQTAAFRACPPHQPRQSGQPARESETCNPVESRDGACRDVAERMETLHPMRHTQGVAPFLPSIEQPALSRAAALLQFVVQDLRDQSQACPTTRKAAFGVALYVASEVPQGTSA